jgi:hypothetical protein
VHVSSIFGKKPLWALVLSVSFCSLEVTVATARTVLPAARTGDLYFVLTVHLCVVRIGLCNG